MPIRSIETRLSNAFRRPGYDVPLERTFKSRFQQITAHRLDEIRGNAVMRQLLSDSFTPNKR